MHGGGYGFGRAQDLLDMMLADELAFPLYSIDYSLAPGAIFPVAIHEAVRAYAALTGELGANNVLTGISAGGGLALAMIQEMRRLDLPLPRALGLDTPWSDLAPVGDSYEANLGRDTLRWTDHLERAASNYAGDGQVTDPLLSPIHAEYDATFPPSIITTGTRDLFLSDCARLHRKLRNAGAISDLRVWEGMWHGFQGNADLPESREAWQASALFQRSHLT